MNRLKELREERGLTTRAMADLTEINHVVITNYENEKRDLSTKSLRKLSEFFEVTTDYLLCINNYCVFARYKEGNYMFTIRYDYYKELRDSNYIYFDNNNHRCIDINSLVGVSNSSNVIGLFEEFTRIEQIDAIFDNKYAKPKDFEKLDDKIEEIELTRGLVERIKSALR